MGTIGILRSSPIRGTFPNSLGALVEPEYCKTEKPFFFRFFRIYGQTGSGKREKWVFLESSRKARSVDTPAIPVAALVEPQQCKTGKTLFFSFSVFTAKPDPKNGKYEYRWNP